MKNFCLWSRWYDRDQIYHPVWNNKKQTQYMKWQLSRHLTSNIGQWFLRGRKQMRWTLWVSQLITLKDFPGHGTERGKIPFFVFPPFQNSQTEATRVHRTEYQREQRCTDREFQRCAKGLSWVFSKALISIKLPEFEGKLWKRFRGNILLHSHKTENSPYSLKPGWKTS